MVPDEDSVRSWRAFLEEESEAAFGDVVRRHVDLVYSTALRRCGGDAALAKDVTQNVFTDLIRKARQLPRDVVLVGWLHRHTTFVAGTWIRAERRRKQREETAMELQRLNSAPDWSAVAPVIEDVLQELPERDRIAIILRYLDQQPFARVGAQMGTSEDAARMRVDRALGRLRGLLERRGIRSTVAALGMVLTQHATTAAPAGLASAIAAAALASVGVASATSSATMGVLQLMNTTKLSVGVAALVTTGLATTAWMEHQENRRLADELKAAAKGAEVLRTDLESTQGSLARTAEELAGLKQQQVDWMRLRDRAARAREAEDDLARLRAENLQLRAAVTAANSGQDPTQTDEKSNADATEEATRGLALARMNYVKNWGMAMLLCANANGGRMPESFEEAAGYFPEEWKSVMSAFDANKFQIVYSGSLGALANPAATIILREKEGFRPPGRDGAQTPVMRTYLFADGHSEIHSAPDGDFGPWEAKHMVSSETAQAP